MDQLSSSDISEMADEDSLAIQPDLSLRKGGDFFSSRKIQGQEESKLSLGEGQLYSNMQRNKFLIQKLNRLRSVLDLAQETRDTETESTT